MRILHFIVACVALALLAGCAKEPAPTPAPTRASVATPAKPGAQATAPTNDTAQAYDDYAVHVFQPDAQGYTELDWLAMMPPDEIESLKQSATAIVHIGNKRMKQVGSFRIMPDVLGRRIKLPGYVVPVESDDKGRMTEFFFVPFFGACIHVPPPPPNQIVYARLSTPVKTPEIWDAFMLKGVLREETIHNRMAGSAYSMSDAILEPYNG